MKIEQLGSSWGGEKTSTPEEKARRAQLEEARLASDLDLVRRGARYKRDKHGLMTLDTTQSVEPAKMAQTEETRMESDLALVKSGAHITTNEHGEKILDVTHSEKALRMTREEMNRSMNLNADGTYKGWPDKEKMPVAPSEPTQNVDGTRSFRQDRAQLSPTKTPLSAPRVEQALDLNSDGTPQVSDWVKKNLPLETSSTVRQDGRWGRFKKFVSFGLWK